MSKKNKEEEVFEGASQLRPPLGTRKAEGLRDASEQPRDGGRCECPEKTSSSSWVYSDIVKEHFLNPKNFLMGDESKFPHNAEGLIGNPICGDQMKMFLVIEERSNPNTSIISHIIKDVKWKTYGCASAIASTSALSELAKGKTLDEALQIDAKQIADYLGGLPPHKFHCSVLGHQALKNAIDNYRQSHKQNPTKT